MSDKISIENIKSVASILSAIAIPVVLALTGYFVQQSIAEDGIKKDYLTMAMGMLKEGGSKLDPELKSWATAVVSKYSPVPFSAEAKDRLSGAIYIEPFVPDLPAIARQTDISDICKGGCSAALTAKHEEWIRALDGKTGDEALATLVAAFDESVRHSADLAGALDAAKISGNACVSIYEVIKGHSR
ncbi:hypothetical protein [Pseudomonas lactis]|uniref:hypothetical protein n=1 Tax=Pseudomonas lactis TaxID=1615674 RepID=UPI000646A7FA|nr:hypothetical protein [Pseudomonas lactis]